MTVAADCITGNIKIRFDRKPVATFDWDLLNAMKAYGFKWEGYGDSGKWQAGKEAVAAFEDKAFRARIKLAVVALSFYDTKGSNVDMMTFINDVQAFDADKVDDDLSTLRPSKVLPDTPSKGAESSSSSSNKRARS